MVVRWRKIRGCLVALLALVLPVGQSVAGEACAVKGDNYIQDPDFTLEAENSRSKHWSGMQHAGERSFEIELNGDVLTITKIATQPWYVYRQRLTNNDDLAGKKMLLSAEFKLSQQQGEQVYYPDVGSGLTLTIFSGSGSDRYRVNMPEDYVPGSDQWQLLQVVVRVPKKARQVQLGFMHELQGSLQVRKPSFRELDQAKNTCNLTPSS